MKVTCVVDGAKFDARADAKYCSERCRKRAKRARQGEPDTPVDLIGAVQSELTELGQLDSTFGQQAIWLAERLQNGSGRDTGSGFASLNRELTAVMDRLRSAPVAHKVSPMDELAAQRAARRGAA